MLMHEAAVRAAVFASVLAAMLIWEQVAPRRVAATGRLWRRLNNSALLLVGTGVLRFAVPVLAIGAAVWAQGRAIGLFNRIDLPTLVVVPVAVVLLDLGIYWQHRLFHAVPLLWRLHRVHHADPDFDVTTALRFHPLEMLVSMAVKLALVLALGAPPLAVLLFEIILNAMAMFNHGNVALPARVDAALRRVIVTPDLHRIHHSVVAAEQQHNFGFNLSLWDRWFGTWQAQPHAGHATMLIGQPAWRSARDQRLDKLLLQPLQSDHQALSTAAAGEATEISGASDGARTRDLRRDRPTL
jgi:sterol desaturase/sphingolipid hydroxylase (fatty acid hydroxylase superfamily)